MNMYYCHLLVITKTSKNCFWLAEIWSCKEQLNLLSGNHIVTDIVSTTVITTTTTIVQGLYHYIPKTNHVCRVYNVAAVLWPQIVVSSWWFLLLLFLSSSPLLSPLCRVLTIMYLHQTRFLGYILLQLLCINKLCYM
jgi:hypothetical protein